MSARKKTMIIRSKEELMNTITHGVGAIMAITGLFMLITMAVMQGTFQHVIGFSIFGLSMVVLYLASTLYHATSHRQLKELLRKFDHMAIYLLIAGTYTPFCLIALPGWIGWTILLIVWFCAITGIIAKMYFSKIHEGLSTFLYILMGWLILPAIQPLYSGVGIETFVLLMGGGVFYTTGTIFFLKDHKKYFHSVWHIFVLTGSAFHFFSVLSLLD